MQNLKSCIRGANIIVVNCVEFNFFMALHVYVHTSLFVPTEYLPAE